MRLTYLTQGIVILSLLSSSLSTLAENPCPQIAHTWNSIIIKDKTAPWRAQLTVNNEEGGFVDAACQLHDNRLLLDRILPDSRINYGTHYISGDDFNVSYSLVLTQQKLLNGNYVAKVCHFVITANAPARPDIRVMEYNGAQCSYDDQKTGIAYTAQ